MNNNYNCHYKERDPNETVKIISNFFNKKKLDIKVSVCIQSEIGTWSCGIQLFNKNNDLILSTNGKGMTKEYALASGYAEMYERFCNNGLYYNFDYLIHNVLIQRRQIKNKFKYNINEKKGKLQDILLSDNNFKEYFVNNLKIDNKNMNNLLSLIVGNEPIVIPYKNIFNNSIKYYNPLLMNIMRGSGGMVAGNTLREAINQGLSELFEHHVCGYLYSYNKNFIFHYLDLSKIEDDNIQNLIKNIKLMGNEVYLIDFSYNFKMPVIMCLLIDKENHKAHVNIGSFPVFEIAVERTLTEIYQGIEKINEIPYILEPSRDKDIFSQSLESLSCITLYPSINENLFLNKKNNCNPNKEIFLFKKDKNYDNNDVYYYYKELCNKLNINVYYSDNSLDENMFAIYLYSPELTHYYDAFNGLKNLPYNELYQLLYYLNLFEIKWLKYHIFDENLVDQILSLQNVFNQRYTGIFGCPCFTFSYGKEFENLILLMLSSNLLLPEAEIIELVEDTFLEKICKKYLLIYRYSISKNYSEIEKINILNSILDEKITSKELIDIQNKKYFLLKAILEPIYNYYHSKKYLDFIDSFI